MRVTFDSPWLRESIERLRARRLKEIAEKGFTKN